MADKHAELLAELEKLKNAYLEQLPGRLSVVEDAVAALVSNGKDQRTPLETLRTATHRLAGSGATFGFSEISTHAKKIELVCDAHLERGQPLSDSECTELSSMVEDLMSVSLHGPDEAPDGGQEAGPLQQISRHDSDLRIFVVEDDVLFAEQISKELKSFGFKVDVFHHPDELSARISEEDPAAIIMDVVFGKDDKVGLKTIEKLKAEDIIVCPVIFLSSRDDMGARLSAVRAGCDAYLFKPVNIGSVVDTLDRLMSPEDVEPNRVMIVDDDPAIARFVDVVLRGAGMITHVLNDPMKVLEEMDSFAPELILLDLYMPGCNGQELAAVIRQQESFAGISIVYLSGESDTAKQLSALRHGADDFLTKPIRADHLIASVKTRVQRFRLLRSLMVRDAMTGLYNHTTLRQSLENELARSLRHHQPMSFALFDIDFFKNVNDTYGHGVGDVVIKSLARLLKQRLRKTDQIGRLGGEEFGVVFPNTGVENATVICEQIRLAFCEICHHADEGDFSVTLSCGIAALPGFENASDFSDAADAALYEAKRGGRNRVIVAPGTE